MVGAAREPGPLVTAEWLKDHISAPDVKVADATWIAPFLDPDRTGQDVYEKGHIPGAVFFDIDRIADRSSFLPHMMPTPEQFAQQASELGLGDGCQIVLYDQNGYAAAARAWWMFRAMGHDDILVLDGGMNAWQSAGGAVDDIAPRISSHRPFTSKPSHALMRDLSEMRSHVASADVSILDARPAGRFLGQAPEPREGLASGHMPGAINLPHISFLSDDGRFKSPDDIRECLIHVGADMQRPVVTTCGSGVTAAILSLGLAVAGFNEVALYDGSWSEWGGADNAPVATGGQPS